MNNICSIALCISKCCENNNSNIMRVKRLDISKYFQRQVTDWVKHFVNITQMFCVC